MLKRPIALVPAGAAAGTLGGIALNRVLASLLTEVGRLDVTALSGASALIVTVAMIACVVPALSAARSDPAVALKTE